MGCQKTTIVPFEPWHQEQYLCNRSAIISEVIISFISFHWTLVSSSYLPFYSGRKAQKTELAARCQTFFFEQAVIHFKQNRANIGLSLLEKQDRCFDKNVCVNPA